MFNKTEIYKASGYGSPSTKNIFNNIRNEILELEYSFQESFGSFMDSQKSFSSLIKAETMLLDLVESYRKALFSEIIENFSGDLDKTYLGKYHGFIIFSEHLKNQCLSRLHAFVSNNNSSIQSNTSEEY